MNKTRPIRKLVNQYCQFVQPIKLEGTKTQLKVKNGQFNGKTISVAKAQYQAIKAHGKETQRLTFLLAFIYLICMSAPLTILCGTCKVYSWCI